LLEATQSVDLPNVDEGNIIGFKGSKRKVLVVDDRKAVMRCSLDFGFGALDGLERSLASLSLM